MTDQNYQVERENPELSSSNWMYPVRETWVPKWKLKEVVLIDRTLDINHPHGMFVRKKRKSFADSHRSYRVVISKIKAVIIPQYSSY